MIDWFLTNFWVIYAIAIIYDSTLAMVILLGDKFDDDDDEEMQYWVGMSIIPIVNIVWGIGCSLVFIIKAFIRLFRNQILK